jgi:cryptochrome
MSHRTAHVTTHTAAIHWFRKGLRLHDSPALIKAVASAARVYPVFCIDPAFANADVVGINRYSFLLECLRDLDRGLRALGSRLFVVRGRPEEQLPLLVERWGVTLVTWEVRIRPHHAFYIHYD